MQDSQATVPGAAQAPGTPDRASRTRRRGFAALIGRRLGELLVAAGLLAFAWVFVVWQWGDPITGFYAKRAQGALTTEYAELERTFVPAVKPLPAVPLDVVLRQVEQEAHAYRARLGVGDAVGVLDVPRLDLDVIVVNGTDTDSLKRGPGAYEHVPGEGELVYVAGHRTTYGAPFADIERLEPGDTIRFDLPYARFTYEVTGHRIVGARALEVLRSRGVEQLTLQACHPRFFATHRYLADAKLVRLRVRSGADEWRTYAIRS